MSMRKLTATTAATVFAFTLAACGEAEKAEDEAGDKVSTAPSTAEVPATAESASESASPGTSDGTDDKAEDDQVEDDKVVAAQHDLPAQVSGYTDEAQSEMGEESVAPEDVERLLAAANNKEAGVEIEWDDDGYWEIGFGDIDIDIDPYGLVLDVDRDN